MNSLRNIWSVSAYERKTLYRSWFFRIFAILALLFLFGINMGLFGSQSEARWTYRAIAANLPYINVLLINVAQAIIAIFLASEFLKRDKKLDTTEVIYARPISNGEYVIGKTLGIISLFIGLVVLSLVMALIFNLIRIDTPVAWQAYILYPLLITIPTLVFILGLSFFLMILFRSQAVTFLILLGYIGLTLFYLKDKMNGLLDYMAFNLPMVYSDFIQFADLPEILLHRLTYLFLGIGFIFGTIRFLGRLPQTGRWNFINLAGFIIFLSIGGYLGYSYFNNFKEEIQNRKEYLSLNNKYVTLHTADIISNKIDLVQQGNKLLVSSQIALSNPNDLPLDTLLFSLNPGFKVDSVISRSGELKFDHKKQILLIFPDQAVSPGRRNRLTIYYSGTPDESIAYLDIPNKRINALKRLMVAPIDKKPGIIDAGYLLLTKELMWYPVAGVGFNKETFLPSKTDFVSYSLSVHPNKYMVPVSQGRVEVMEEKYNFLPEKDLSALSLAIGPFEKKSLTIKGIEYNLFLKQDHDYFSGYFSNITDTIASIIESELDDYEREELDLYYPFSRINLVEVPVQFHAYERPYMQTTEFIQPEMIFMPERGVGLNTLDFARYSYAEQRRNRRREEAKSQVDIETDQLKRFLQGTFFNNNSYMRLSSGSRQGRGERLISYDGDVRYTRNPYNVFPLYYNYMTGITSDEYSMFNSMIEIYLKEGFEVSPRQSFMGGMSDAERANLELAEHSMSEIFSRWNTSLSSSLISQTGSFIILALKNRVGSGEFDNFLYYYLEDHAFTEITFEKFAADFREEFEVDIRPYFSILQTSSNLPVFRISTPEYIQSRDEIGEVYLIRFRISNVGESKGMVDVTLRMPGQGGFGSGGMNTEQRLYELDPGTTKDIQISVFDVPRMVTINTLISGNIPSTFNTFLRSAIRNDNIELEEYDRVIDDLVTTSIEGEYIVDNEDPGFSYITESGESKLKQYIDSRKEKSDKVFYQGINPYRRPAKWTPVAHTAFYGESIRSAILCSSGDGGNIARWTTLVPESGFYDIEVYIPISAMYKRPEGRGRGGGNQGGQSSGGRQGGRPGPTFADEGFDYHYTISSSAGTDEVEFVLRNIEEGWNKIGSFYFPADSASIELSNRTSGNRVIADAVKWVKKPE